MARAVRQRVGSAAPVVQAVEQTCPPSSLAGGGHQECACLGGADAHMPRPTGGSRVAARANGAGASGERQLEAARPLPEPRGQHHQSRCCQNIVVRSPGHPAPAAHVGGSSGEGRASARQGGAPVDDTRAHDIAGPSCPAAAAADDTRAHDAAAPPLDAFYFLRFAPRNDTEVERSRQARWERGMEEAEDLVTAALERHGPDDVAVVAQPWMEVSMEVLLQRVTMETVRVTRGGGRAYIGSTSDPGWRWRGGYYLPSPGDRGGRRHSHHRNEWEFLPGHHLQWRHLLVLGCWRDHETRLMETEAIKQGQRVAPGRLTNKVSDARGLEVRPWSFSFVYICYGKKYLVAVGPSRHCAWWVEGRLEASWMFVGLSWEAFSRASWKPFEAFWGLFACWAPWGLVGPLGSLLGSLGGVLGPPGGFSGQKSRIVG